jgi:molybdopterin converting factor small subunit
VREDGGAALKVIVRLAAALRQHADGATAVALEVSERPTVAAVLDALASAHPAVGRRVRDEGGILRRHVNVFIGSDNARDLDGVDTVVPEGVEVAVLPAVSGG